MSFNLALLTAAEKNRVELDKQASYLVWRLKQAKAGPEEITKQMAKIASESEKTVVSTVDREVQKSDGRCVASMLSRWQIANSKPSAKIRRNTLN